VPAAPGDTDRGEGRAVFEKSAARTSEGPHDLARVVDPVSLGGNRARDINRGEARSVFEESVVLKRGIRESPHDLASVVDPNGLGDGRAGDINRSDGIDGRRRTSSGHTDE
jgi:hypothetical protein